MTYQLYIILRIVTRSHKHRILSELIKSDPIYLKRLVGVTGLIIVTYIEYIELSIGCGGKAPSNLRASVLGCA